MKNFLRKFGAIFVLLLLVVNFNLGFLYPQLVLAEEIWDSGSSGREETAWDSGSSAGEQSGWDSGSSAREETEWDDSSQGDGVTSEQGEETPIATSRGGVSSQQGGDSPVGDGVTTILGEETTLRTCGDYRRLDPECDWNRQQVYEVYQDSCGNYDRRNYQYQAGSCGYNVAPAAPQTPVAQIQPQQPEVRSCGSFVFKYPECDWDRKMVYEVYQNSCGEYNRRNYQYQEGQCGYSTSRVQTPVQPVPITSGPAPIARAERVITTCKGSMPYSQFESELRGAGYNGSWDDASALRGYNNAACPAEGAAPVIVVQPTPTPRVVRLQPTPAPQIVFINPTPTPAPRIIVTSPVQRSDIRCPAGTNMLVENSTVICVSTQQQAIQNQVVYAYGGNATASTGAITVNVPGQTYTQTVYQPQVVYQKEVATKELPKTGLPLEAIALGGLTPAGWILSRFGKVKFEQSAQYLWERREFLR